MLCTPPVLSQSPPVLPSQQTPNSPLFPEEQIPEEPLPEEPLPPLPSPEELLPPIAPPDPGDDPPAVDPGEGGPTFFIRDIQVVGNTVFSQADFADLIEPYLGRQVSFNELLQLRTAITERYVEAGYLTSGALILPQTIVNDTITIQVLEGELEDIVVNGTQRLSPDYIRSRIGLVADPPLNINRLLAGLQRLQIDPLIATISADLQAGGSPGTNLLVVEVTEADSFAVNATFANNRSPNIGGAQRRVGVSEGNLLGLGDRITVDYNNTDGSNGVNLSYTLPISPNNDTLRLAAGYSNSRVIDPAFSVLDIASDSFYYELGLRRPLIETPTEEFALGLALSHQEGQTRLGFANLGPFPLSPGADDNGSTRVTALRFSQEWTQRSERHVLALRSQFNLGLGILNATVNENAPDSRFFFLAGTGTMGAALGARYAAVFTR